MMTLVIPIAVIAIGFVVLLVITYKAETQEQMESRIYDQERDA
jgi:hypothetical protein